MDWTPFVELVQSGGAVLIAVVVVAALVGGTAYLGHRLIWLPSKRLDKQIAEANAKTAEANKQTAQALSTAAKSHEEAAKFNSETSQQIAATAGHLARLTEMVLSHAAASKS